MFRQLFCLSLSVYSFFWGLGCLTRGFPRQILDVHPHNCGVDQHGTGGIQPLPFSAFRSIFTAQKLQRRPSLVLTVNQMGRPKGHSAFVTEGECIRAVFRCRHNREADAVVVSEVVQLLALQSTVKIQGIARQRIGQRHAIGEAVVTVAGQNAIDPLRQNVPRFFISGFSFAVAHSAHKNTPFPVGLAIVPLIIHAGEIKYKREKGKDAGRVVAPLEIRYTN